MTSLLEVCYRFVYRIAKTGNIHIQTLGNKVLSLSIYNILEMPYNPLYNRSIDFKLSILIYMEGKMMSRQ